TDGSDPIGDDRLGARHGAGARIGHDRGWQTRGSGVGGWRSAGRYPRDSQGVACGGERTFVRRGEAVAQRWISIERVCVLAVLAITLWQVLAPPFVGLADNSDFGKIAGRFSLTPPGGLFEH